MFYCPYCSQINLFRDKNPLSYIRVLHASPGSPPVDVYANKKLIAKNLSYKKFTEYLTIPSGYYNIKVFASGNKTSPLINVSLYVPKNSIFTVAAYNKLKNIKLLPIEEPLISPIPSKAFVRFVHLSPNTPNVDIILPNGTVLFKNVAYTEVTKYIPVTPGNYTIETVSTNQYKKLLTVPNITLKGNKIYTIYAVGLLNGTPPLQALIPLDGRSYIK